MAFIVNLTLLFFLYSFAGWCMEVVLKYIQFHRFINRGFLTGPACPIYGSGAVLITLVIGGTAQLEFGYGTTFILSFLLCGTLEYCSSYFMEKRFHARWWDYSTKPMNLNGRIWIGNLLLFGGAGVLIIHLFNPLVYRGLERIPLTAREIAAGILLTAFAADYAGTHFMLRLLKKGVEQSRADNTEEISREIRELLTNRSVFYKRFADAYPEVIYRTQRINEKLAEIRAEADRFRKEAEASLAERAGHVAATLEPSVIIKNRLIEKQGQLIDMLYNEQTADQGSRDLKTEIENEKARLKSRPFSGLTKSEENT